MTFKARFGSFDNRRNLIQQRKPLAAQARQVHVRGALNLAFDAMDRAIERVIPLSQVAKMGVGQLKPMQNRGITRKLIVQFVRRVFGHVSALPHELA